MYVASLYSVLTPEFYLEAQGQPAACPSVGCPLSAVPSLPHPIPTTYPRLPHPTPSLPTAYTLPVLIPFSLATLSLPPPNPIPSLPLPYSLLPYPTPPPSHPYSLPTQCRMWSRSFGYSEGTGTKQSILGTENYSSLLLEVFQNGPF